MADKIRVPAGCGEDLGEQILFNPQQQEYLKKKRLRFCLSCKRTGSVGADGLFHCACGIVHRNADTAPRVYNVLGLFAGRQGGKTKVGALGAREELLVPNSIGWVMGPTYKILRDSTFPTLIRLIPPAWVRHWDQEHMNLTLNNGAMVAFRSLEDPERARGPHVTWGWFDEAAISPERAWDVFYPTMATTGGAVTLTTSPAGFDWTYNRVWKPARMGGEPGFWAAKYKTTENPIFTVKPHLKMLIERKRRTMDPAVFRQEYEADFVNFTGSIYDYQLLSELILPDAAAVQKFIPEWPNIDPSRGRVIGLDSGVDHPFGAVLIVETDKGLVVVSDYLERLLATSQHLDPIRAHFRTAMCPSIKWAANKNEANLRLEWGLKNVGVIPVENKHEIGIQRVQSWMYARQLYFAYTAPRTIEQMRAYRRADNIASDGQKKDKESVFKQNDELPDALRYALMAWPELPDPDKKPLTNEQQARWDAFDDRTRLDVERMRAYTAGLGKKDLDLGEEGYPYGGFSQGVVESIF